MNGAFDFETFNWVHPLCCGLVSDGEEIFIDFTHGGLSASESQEECGLRIAEAVLHEMAKKPHVKWYAHNMGRFDGLFLSAAATRLGWKQEAQLGGGSRVISFEFTKPGLKKSIKVYDTFALVPESLKLIAEAFELKSRKEFSDDDYSVDTRTWSKEKLKSGCLTDCRLVLELLSRLDSLVDGWGGSLKSTFSSTALNIVRNHLAMTGEEIQNCNVIVQGKDVTFNQLARLGYVGARVEVFDHAPKDLLTEYDINSSYPHAMSGEVPWAPIGWRHCDVREPINGLGCGMVRARVFVPETHSIPCLPYKPESGGVFFPTGEWEAWFTQIELQYAWRFGVDVVPLETLQYKEATPFTQFINEVYSLKRVAKGAKRRFAKDLINGVYGKWGEKPEHTRLMAFGDEFEAIDYMFKHPGTAQPVYEWKDPGAPLDAPSITDAKLLAVNYVSWAKHAHFALASYITSIARINLHRFLIQANGPAYCDSDSIHCHGGLSEHVTDSLGGLKVELSDYKGEFFAPKIYRLTPITGETVYAAKGFPIHNKDVIRNKEVFDTIIGRKKKVTHERMRLLKSQFRAGNQDVKRVITTKSWGGLSMKRKPHSDGTTTPWMVSELNEGVHKEAICPIL